MRSLKLTALAAIVFVVAALGGRAYAYWTATGTGSTTAVVPALDAPTAPEPLVSPSIVASAAPLAPGADGELVLVLHNPNPYAVTLTSVTADIEPPESNAAGCVGAEAVSLNAIVLAVPAPSLPGEGTVTLRLAGAVHMDTHAASACQGAKFTIPVRVEVTL